MRNENVNLMKNQPHIRGVPSEGQWSQQKCLPISWTMSFGRPGQVFEKVLLVTSVDYRLELSPVVSSLKLQNSYFEVENSLQQLSLLDQGHGKIVTKSWSTISGHYCTLTC